MTSDPSPASDAEARARLADELAHRAKHQVWGNMTVRCQEAFPNDPPSWCVGCLLEEAAALLRLPRVSLFQRGDFTLHSGSRATWKIECDALTDADLNTLAMIAAEAVGPFGSVEGVPQGGLRLAAALQPYVTTGPVLIVDDVLTTGRSMEQQRAGREAKGLVIFARADPPSWILPLLRLPRVEVPQEDQDHFARGGSSDAVGRQDLPQRATGDSSALLRELDKLRVSMSQHRDVTYRLGALYAVDEITGIIRRGERAETT